jgi:two-component system nitrate/nitrite response regulator NarL
MVTANTPLESPRSRSRAASGRVRRERDVSRAAGGRRADLISVAIIEDHPLYAFALAELLAPAFQLVGSYCDGSSGLAAICSDPPAVAVLDLQLPSMDGLAVLHGIARAGVSTRAVILSAHTDKHRVWEAFRAGATAFLSKEASADDIRMAIDAAARGEVTISPTLAASVISHVRDGAPAPALTMREREILTLVAEGRSRTEIAGDLLISPATVKAVLAGVYSKLGVTGQSAAVALAIRVGLI